jgi:glyoxylase-like metal-dependent hydrolase (beta-lactamase superfamily II)
VPVFAHPDDTSKIWAKGPRWRDLMPHYAAYFQKLGVPLDDMVAAGGSIASGLRLARRVAEVRPIAEGDVVRTRWASFQVLHMPGHTPGLVCLWDEEHRLFLAADHLLEKVSPNPLIELGPDGEERWKPLLAYLGSVGRLRTLDVGLLLPGHGPAFADHRRVIDELLLFYDRRQARIGAALAEGPLTGFEVMKALFPWAGPEHLFLAMSEAVGNLEVLEARGEVARDLDGGVYRFRAQDRAVASGSERP